MLYALALAPAGWVLGAVIFVLQPYGSPGWMVDTLLSALTVSAGTWMLRRSSYCRLKMTELALAAEWREQVSFLHVLEDAAHKGVLRPSGRACWVFHDRALREALAAKAAAASPARKGKHARRPARTGQAVMRAASGQYIETKVDERLTVARDRHAANRERQPEARKRGDAWARERASAWEQRVSAATAERAEAGKPASVRVLLHTLLSQKGGPRVVLDVSVGASAAFVTWIALAHSSFLLGSRPITEASAGQQAGDVIGLLLLILPGLPIGFVVLLGFLAGVDQLIGWSLLRQRRAGWMGSAGMWAGCGLLAGTVTGVSVLRHGIAAAGVAVLPGMAVAAAGGQACVLARRWFPGKRPVAGRAAGARRPPRWRATRWVPDALVVVTGYGAVLLLIDRSLPAAQAFTALLFPAMVRLCVVAWRVMTVSRRARVRAGADIAFAVSLGTAIVLLLVWLANILNMPPAELAVLHGTADDAGEVIDLPWWVWASVFAVLAGVSLAFARWPGGLTGAIRWFKRLRVVPSVSVTSRMLTGLHIGLLVTALVGLASPVAVAPALRARLAARYTVTLADDLRARGELAAYQEIRREFAHLAPARVSALAALVEQIDAVSKPSGRDRDVTPTETDLARRLGQLQGLTLTDGGGADQTPGLVPASPSADAAAVAQQAGIGAPLRDASDLAERAGEARRLQADEDETAEQVDQAAELAAKAVATALGIPDLGRNEIIQIAREYLSGLVEDSPLTKVFTTWARKLVKNSRNPDAAADGGTTPDGADHGRDQAPPRIDVETVVPDPAKLEVFAETAANQATASMPPSDASAEHQDIQTFLKGNPVTASVDLINQVRYLQEGTGPCEGCAPPDVSGNQHDHIYENHDEP